MPGWCVERGQDWRVVGQGTEEFRWTRDLSTKLSNTVSIVPSDTSLGFEHIDQANGVLGFHCASAGH
jgi:hypothetical protein